MITRRKLIATATTAATLGNVHAEPALETQRFIAQAAHLTVEIPAHWTMENAAPGWITGIGGKDGFFVASPMTMAEVERNYLANESLSPTDDAGVSSANLTDLDITRYTISLEEDGSVATLLIMRNPHPILTASGENDRLVLFGDTAHFDTITSTLTFGLEDIPAPSLAKSVLDILEAHAYYRKGVDWGELRSHASDLKDHEQINRFLQMRTLSMLRSAGDRHSWILPPAIIQQAATSSADIGQPNLPSGQVLNGFGYISFPVHNAFGSTYLTDYARAGAAIRNELADHGVCGWIIDLRSMGGGSITPPLTVLYPFLPDGSVAGFVDAYGEELWITKNGTAITPASYNIELPEYPWPDGLDDPSVPIAVLTGDGTASAGEFTQLALMARENTTSFGGHTAGLTTGNSVFPLFSGGNFALATTAEIAADGIIYTGAIEPDVVDPAISMPTRLNDDTLAPVYDWLHAMCWP